MSKLTDRITAVAEATGKTVLIGKRSHREDWFATVNDIEFDGATPEVALEHVVDELKRQADAQSTSARILAERNQVVKAL